MTTTKPEDPHRAYHVSRRLFQALERHHLPDVAAIHEARDRLRAELAKAPETLTPDELMAFRERLLDAFDAEVARVQRVATIPVSHVSPPRTRRRT